MRELTMMEISEVSGGGFFSRIGGIALGSLTGLIQGVVKGVVVGGQAGGLLGVGAITGVCGLAVGAVLGLISGTVYGAINDEKQMLKIFNTMMENVFDWLAPNPK